MTDQHAQLHELPTFWQEQIRKLRSENYQLRARTETAELSPRWRRTVRKLREENGKYRVERNAAVSEIARLRAELEARSDA